MKLSTILAAAAAVVGVSAKDRYGNSPEDVIRKIQAEGEWNRWPTVVHCPGADVYGVNWSQTKAFISRGIFTYQCTITWCDPDNGSCKFELKGDGGAANWWQVNWNRDGKKLCYPKPCNQM
ncbi:hypothetical protein ABW20_dc0107177 [Dactylellina cionopaga]|nr:hypothetical protein ABW20_dc0107177 [Dactylellina cionopaga]